MDIDVIIDESSDNDDLKKIPYIYLRLDTKEEIEMMLKLVRSSAQLSRVIVAESGIEKPEFDDYIKPNVFTNKLVEKIYYPLRRLFFETKGEKL